MAEQNSLQIDSISDNLHILPNFPPIGSWPSLLSTLAAYMSGLAGHQPLPPLLCSPQCRAEQDVEHHQGDTGQQVHKEDTEPEKKN